jgi:hypothetical protein
MHLPALAPCVADYIILYENRKRFRATTAYTKYNSSLNASFTITALANFPESSDLVLSNMLHRSCVESSVTCELYCTNFWASDSASRRNARLIDGDSLSPQCKSLNILSPCSYTASPCMAPALDQYS